MSRTFSVTSNAVKALLTGGGEFVPPERLLAGLTEAQVLTVPPGSPYSIAQLVAHMHWWQAHQIARARGETQPRPEHLDDTFMTPSVGTWESLVDEFLAGLKETGEVARERGSQTSPDRDDTDLAYDLAECPAMHNAYHLGQIALLRQIQGFWPPIGGDDSW